MGGDESRRWMMRERCSCWDFSEKSGESFLIICVPSFLFVWNYETKQRSGRREEFRSVWTMDGGSSAAKQWDFFTVIVDRACEFT